jgi:hypothetical protein
VVSFTPQPLCPQGNSPWYPLDRRVVGPQSRSGRCGEEKNSQPLPGLESPIIQFAAQRYNTELSQFLNLSAGINLPLLLWRRVLAEKLTVAQLVKKNTHLLWNPHGSLPSQQKHSTGCIKWTAQFLVIYIPQIQEGRPLQSRDSSVGIALRYGLDDRGSGVFLFTTAFRPALGLTQPPIQWVLGALSVGVKRQGRETDHSPPSSERSKNAWRYTSTPQYAFMARCSV